MMSKIYRLPAAGGPMEGDVEPTALCPMAYSSPPSRVGVVIETRYHEHPGMRFALASREICAAAVLRFTPGEWS
jgi:hypothetical protein